MRGIRPSKRLGLLALVAVLLGLLAACGQPTGPGSATFSYKVDPSIAPQPATLGTRPLAAVSDDKGHVTLFIADAFLVRPTSQGQLDAMLQDLKDHGLIAEVIGIDSVEPPPASSNLTMDPTYAKPTTWLVRIDPSRAGAYLDGFAKDAVQAGYDGSITVLPRRLREGRCPGRLRRQHHGLQHRRRGVAGSRHPRGRARPQGGPRLRLAGRRLHLHRGGVHRLQRLSRRLHLPPLRGDGDGGFWLDASGQPGTAFTGLWASDLPSLPVQYDFVDDDYFAGGPNDARCTGGSGCPWHGNGSAGTAAGLLNNRYGAAGTGGLVADPWLFKTDFSDSQVQRAVRTAVAWGADVVSMSFGGSCNWFCRRGRRAFTGYNDGFADARSHGLVLVAAAGNDNVSVNDNSAYPCMVPGVICVGALAGGTSNKISYSNYGSGVDIWAPTDINVMPNPSTTPNNANHNGTSASAPFIAGVAAMLKAFDHDLTSDNVDQLLRDHAWADSSDPHVDRYVNAYASLRTVAGAGADVPPSIGLSVASTTVDLNRGFQVTASTSDLEDGAPCCAVTWVPSPDVASGFLAVFSFATVGSHTVNATATDRGGATAAASLTVDVVNTAPTPTIELPRSGAHVLSGANVQLLGSATDPNEGPGPGPGTLGCSGLLWYSTDDTDTAFPAAGCNVTVKFNTVASRTLELRATDPQGAHRSTYVSIVVDAPPANYPPDIALGSLPAFNYNGDGFKLSSSIGVTASATDPEGDTPITYTWIATSYQPESTTAVYARNVVVAGPTTAGGALTWTPSDTPSLFIPDCTGAGGTAYFGQRVVVGLQATDSLGHSSLVTLPTFKVYRCTVD